jgi:hypothetical protein
MVKAAKATSVFFMGRKIADALIARTMNAPTLSSTLSRSKANSSVGSSSLRRCPLSGFLLVRRSAICFTKL